MYERELQGYVTYIPVLVAILALSLSPNVELTF
jgi:hypothetical protein